MEKNAVAMDPKNKEMPKAGRNRQVDLLKIIACIGVVGLHTFWIEGSAVSAALYYLCGFAVPVFFMSSGYFLLNRGEVNPLYSARKIVRVGKVILCWTAISAVGGVCTDVAHHTLSYHTLLYWPTITFRALLQKGSMWHFWYFGTLILLYLCLPLLTRFRKYLSHVWMALVLLGFVLQVSSYWVGTPLQMYVRQTFRLWTALQYFLLGGLTGGDHFNHVKKMAVKRHGIVLAVVTVFVVIFQYTAGRHLLHNHFAEYFYDSPLMVVWVLLLFTFVLKLVCSDAVNQWMSHIAPLTMGIYIIHPLLIRMTSQFAFFQYNWLSSLLYFGIILFVSYLFALVLYKVKYLSPLIKL